MDILGRMHWGVLTNDDIDILNTRFINNIDVQEHADRFQNQNIEDYFAPIAISTNNDRCIYNDASIISNAQKNNTCIYEILASSSDMKNVHKFKNFNEQYTDKICLLLKFHIFCQPSMITKRIKALEKVKRVANGTLGWIIGFSKTVTSKPIMASNIEEDNDNDYIISYTAEGVKIKRFKLTPEYILFKIRGCNDILMSGYPEGVLLIPYAAYSVKIKAPKAKEPKIIRLDQFPIIPAYALTPEKLQGVTLYHDMYITSLSCRSSQILYVAFSRTQSLQQIILTEEVTMNYVRKFLPKRQILTLVTDLMEKIDLPDYIVDFPNEYEKYERWLSLQHDYCNEAWIRHRTKKK
jgi:hypothetical protein